MSIELTNPIVLTIGAIVLLALIYLWNRHNRKLRQSRKKRSFRQGYYERKREREKERNGL